MRLILAFDTATAECAVGLGEVPSEGSDGDREPRLLGETNVSNPRAALTHILPMVERLLEQCGRVPSDLDAVVVGRGPGSFTGVRIGMATAKGVASGLGVPLFGVGTADAIAERFATRDGLVGVVGDAMRREVYPALFRCVGGRVDRLTPDAVMVPREAAERWAAGLAEDVVLAGDGLAKYTDIFLEVLGDRARIAPIGSWTPTGAGLLAAAWRAGVLAGSGDPGTVLPAYTRLSDAEENEASRGAVVSVLPDSGVAGPETGGERT